MERTIKRKRRKEKIILHNFIFFIFSFILLFFSNLYSNETEYKIGIGDDLDIYSTQSPDLIGAYKVSLEGKIVLPLIKDIYVYGLTIKQLEQILNEKAKEYVKNPGIIITLRNIGAKKIHVIGRVVNQGIIPYRENLYILDVIASAGGLIDGALLSKTKIFRGEPGKRKTIDVDLKKIMENGNFQNDILIEPEDIIYIPKGEVENWNYFLTKIMPTLTFFSTIVMMFLLVRSL